jgi:hypothetical protein
MGCVSFNSKLPLRDLNIDIMWEGRRSIKRKERSENNGVASSQNVRIGPGQKQGGARRGGQTLHERRVGMDEAASETPSMIRREEHTSAEGELDLLPSVPIL